MKIDGSTGRPEKPEAMPRQAKRRGWQQTIAIAVAALIASNGFPVLAGELSLLDRPPIRKPDLQAPRVGFKPHLLSNASRPLDPLTKQRAFNYRSRLKQVIFELERSPRPASPGAADTLRGARRELSRINRELR